MDILYLHGLASSPSGRKATLLRGLLEPQGFRITAPDLNLPTFARLDFEAMSSSAAAAGIAVPPRVIVGSSLGGMVALETVRRGVRAPLVLVAPAVDMAASWTRRLPDGDPVRLFHHGAGAVQPIHRAFFESMWKVTSDRDPPAVPVSVVMGTSDESVPFDVVRGTWDRWRATGRLAGGSEFVTIPGGDHGLLDFAHVIAAAVRRRAAHA